MSIPVSPYFPVYNQAVSVPVWFLNTTGGLVTSWNGNVTNITIIPDAGASSSLASPNTLCVETGSTGMGTLSLTAAQTQCYMLQISITVSNASSNAFLGVIHPLRLVESGAWESQSPITFEQIVLNIAACDRNLFTQGAGATATQTVKKIDGLTTYLTGLMTADPVSGVVRNKLS